MLQLSFSAQKDAILSHVRNTQWDENSGLGEEALLRECRRIDARLGDAPRMTKKAAMIAYILDHARIAVDEHSIFTDRICCTNVLGRIREEWFSIERAKPENRADFDAAAVGVSAAAWDDLLDTSHTAPDWDHVLSLGFHGLIEYLQDARSLQESNGTLTKEKAVFYDGCVTVFRAILRLIGRYISAVEKLPQTPQSRLALEVLCGIYNHAPASVPEAMEFMLLWYTLQTFVERTDVRSMGRLDKHLLPFFRKDLENGCEEEDMDDFFRFFFWQFTAMNHYNNVPFVLGGEPDGVNALTWRILRVYDAMNIFNPKIQIRVTRDIPDDLLRTVLASIRKGNSSYVFMNDDSVIPALEKLGMPRAHAENYVPVGCYEPMSLGHELPCTSTGKIVLPKVVELTLNDGFDPMTGTQVGIHTGTAETFETSDEFEQAFYAQVDYCMTLMRRGGAAYDRVLPKVNPSPMLSAGTKPCVERGVDIYNGGADYNSTSFNPAGISNAVDSLLAIRKAVFTEKRITLSALRDLLNNNWEDGEAVRRYLGTRCPKYGNGDPEADAETRKMYQFVSERINFIPNARGGFFRMGTWTVDGCFVYGSKTGATPDGRFRGETLSKNICPVTGMDRQGITALVNSVTVMDTTLAPNGSVLDLVLHPTAVQGEAGLNAMLTLLKTYCKNGGQGIQFNVFDADMLRRAKAEPEKYASLQVRVCGWNAYFVNLSQREQDRFILQAECAERAG